ncbi:uncharacterized protein [Periplaneta americana]|uniref:uncharacterized protein n=1 Tax=Periplaneta americana TaxID=6978 RepID=UPI0037E82E29
MSCQADLYSWLASAQKCFTQTFRPCFGWMPCLQRRRQIHPTAVNSFAGNLYVQLSSHRKIRVIHIDASRHTSNSWHVNKEKTHLEAMGHQPEICNFSSKHRSLSLCSNFSELSTEDYWFKRWNRPLTMSDTCSCSFRKSWRNSLGDSRLMINQTEEETNRRSQLFDSTPLSEIYVEEEDIIQMENSQVESFVEDLLQKIWKDVYLCLSKTDHESESKSRYLSSDTHDSCEFGTIENNKSDVLVSCHQMTGDSIVVEAINDNIKDSLITKSVGCVNPSFLGSSADPDLLDYIADPVSNCGDSSPVETAEDTDSGFNTVSLESTTHNTNEAECSAASKIDSECSNTEVPACVTENTQIESLTASPIGIHVNVLQPQISNYNEAKDDSQGYNQTAFTSVDLGISNTCETQNTEHKNVQLGRNKQCRHTRNVGRLKPLLYFLHGVGCSADLWTTLIQHFTTAGFEVVAPDMLGHGYSSAPDNASAYSFHRLLKDCLDIFDRFVGEHRRCVVIGHAYGCSLAAALARYRPAQISHLVLISGGGPAPLAPRTADSRPPSISPCLMACMKPLLMCGFRRNIIYAPCGKHIESCPSMSKGIPQYVLEHVAQGQDWPEGDATFHRRILIPTLLVHGLQDSYVTLVQECEMERTIPRSFLELIPDAGHFSMLETPTRLSHMIHCFIDWWSR